MRLLGLNYLLFSYYLVTSYGYLFKAVWFSSKAKSDLGKKNLEKFPCNTKRTMLYTNLMTEIEEDESLKKIIDGYLSAKFLSSNHENYNHHTSTTSKDVFNLKRSKNDVLAVMMDILPPLSDDEMKREVDHITTSLGETVTFEEFQNEILNNKYWKEVNSLIIKEIIYLDALYHFYHKKVRLLGDEDYNNLKELLLWEGSSAATMSGKEALFIFAISSFHKGHNVLSNTEYNQLKSDLQASNSWIVQRHEDPLERLGMNTFMAYLHRSL